MIRACALRVIYPMFIMYTSEAFTPKAFTRNILFCTTDIVAYSFLARSTARHRTTDLFTVYLLPFHLALLTFPLLIGLKSVEGEDNYARIYL